MVQKKIKLLYSTGMVVLTLFFAAVHFFYSYKAAYFLWSRSGGITESVHGSVYGKEWAWTIPVHLAGGIFYYYGVQTKGLENYRLNPKPESIIGLVLILSGTLLASLFSALLVLRLIKRDQPLRRSFYWKIFAIFLCWGWIPVPASMSYIFQWTVVY